MFANCYQWDENSPGPKPPPPPTAILITGLSPLTTVDQISKFFRAHGRIKEIDSKMDPKTGMQLGICWLSFEGPLPGRPGSAHDVAMHVVRTCSGQRVGLTGNERVTVVLDGRGVRVKAAVKEEMERRNKPKPKPPTPAQVAPTPKAPPSGPKASTPSEGRETPKPSFADGPGPRFQGLGSMRGRPAPPLGGRFGTLNRSMPVGRFQPPLRGAQDFSRDFRMAPDGRRGAFQQDFSGAFQQDFSRDFRGGGASARRGDRYSPSPSRSRSRSRSVSSYSSDSDDDRPSYRKRRSPSPNRRTTVKTAPAEADEAGVERVKKAITDNGRAYVFIDIKSLPYGQVRDEHVQNHFRAFKPDAVLHNHTGWYILFGDDQTAHRAKLMDKTAILSHRINVEVKQPTAKAGEGGVTTAMPEKGGWKFLTFTKKRPSAMPVKKRAPSPKPKPKPHRRRSFSYSSSSDEDEMVAAPKVVPSKRIIESDEEDEAKPEVKPKKKLAKKEPVSKDKKVAKKKVVTDDVDVSMSEPTTPAVAEIQLGKPAEKKPPPKPKAAPKKVSAVEKLVKAGTIEDDEDAYWLAQALSLPEDADTEAMSDAEPELPEDHPLHHASGAWRAEGIRNVAPILKSTYLPQRNRAAGADAAGGAAGASGRTARIAGRRLAQDIETNRKAGGGTATAAESDLFMFNQLRIRKKQLRFARSAIEGYGLYAMETIQPGEMVCEYVGELCRSSVADVREQRYTKQGIGSSYLFRIDGDIVCDATFKGSVSRLINHSCNPTANAKIININGHNKIVIYAKRTLYPGDEVTYSYNFPLEQDESLRVRCLCGEPTCLGFLN